MAPREPDSCPGPLSDQGRGSSSWGPFLESSRDRGLDPGGRSPAPLPTIPSPGQLRLPGVKSVWPGQESEQLSTPPTLLQDSWAGGEALARERHLPVSGEKEDTREGLRGRGRPLGAGRPLSMRQEELPLPVGALARPSWWEGAGRRRVHIHLDAGGTLGPGRGSLPPIPVCAICEKGHAPCPGLRAGLDPLQHVCLPIWGKEWLKMDMGFLAVTDLEAWGSLGTPLWGGPPTHPPEFGVLN